MSRSLGPAFFTILMPPEPEEYLPGTLWRNSLTSGRRRMKGQVDRLLARQVIEPPWIVPSNLELLARTLGAVFTSPDEIVRNHTCLPALLPFARPDSLERILGHVMRGESHCGVPSMLGLGGNYIQSRPTLALCLECVKQDMEALGFTYWRRFHNLPGLTYCVMHRQPLVAGCGRCAYSGPKVRAPRLPKLSCWCGQPHVRLPAPRMPVDRATLMTIATLALQLLRGALTGRTPVQVGAYYAMQARAGGFGGGSRLHTPEIAQAFKDRYSPELLQQLNASIGSARTNWLEKALGRGEAPIVLTRNLLLFDFFGSRLPTSEEIDFAVASEVEIRSTKKLFRGRPRPPSYDAQEARCAVEAYLVENPQAGRTQLLRALGRTAANVRDFDGQWYEQRLAARRAKDPLTPEKRLAYSQEFDERTARHVRERREFLLAVAGQPKRITRRALLTECPRGNEVTSARETQMPSTRKALAQCVESSSAYKERYALYVLETAPADLDRHEEAKRRTGLPMERILKLVAKLILRRVA